MVAVLFFLPRVAFGEDGKTRVNGELASPLIFLAHLETRACGRGRREVPWKERVTSEARLDLEWEGRSERPYFWLLESHYARNGDWASELRSSLFGARDSFRQRELPLLLPLL